MKIGPNHDSSALGRSDNNPAPRPKKAVPDKSDPPVDAAVSQGNGVDNKEDSVQLTGAEGAHRLVLYRRPEQRPIQAADAPETKSNDHGKLEQIRRRIESGFYDRPEVRNKIAERLAEELTRTDSQQQLPEDYYGNSDD